MSIEHRPLYYQSHGDMVAQGPYRFKDAVAFCFMVPADRGALQNLCDTWIVNPTNREVLATPFLPYLSIVFIYYPSVWTIPESPEVSGVIPYKEMIVAMTVNLKTTSCFSMPKVYGFMPYLFLDHPRAICIGREVFGMPKVFSDIYLPDGGAIRSFKVETNAVGQFRNSFSQATRKNLMEITGPPGLNYMDYMPKSSSPKITDLHDQIHNTLGSGASATYRQTEQATQTLQADSLSFKQIRNYFSDNQVSYKALLKYQTSNYQFHAGGMLRGEYKIRFPEYSDMFPLKRTLGLYPKVSAAFWMRSSFDLFMGPEMWNPETKSGISLF